ncbi:mRNA degradation protein mitochondrial [Cyphellophora attinorum]|uniref:mRNA degradation protein mitochondrial n=1 Tax=Cyphellophora attinorum TaxID=1664694 RepID=A0A0N1HB45_9EURO|nr:mRNA degradation protein mitochondrial [Phialophora attinorum]KPI41434.1 mRNA degradation protein mitochondrial [Phialophora attinorum]
MPTRHVCRSCIRRARFALFQRQQSLHHARRSFVSVAPRRIPAHLETISEAFGDLPPPDLPSGEDAVHQSGVTAEERPPTLSPMNRRRFWIQYKTSASFREVVDHMHSRLKAKGTTTDGTLRVVANTLMVDQKSRSWMLIRPDMVAKHPAWFNDVLQRLSTPISVPVQEFMEMLESMQSSYQSKQRSLELESSFWDHVRGEASKILSFASHFRGRITTGDAEVHNIREQLKAINRRIDAMHQGRLKEAARIRESKVLGTKKPTPKPTAQSEDAGAQFFTLIEALTKRTSPSSAQQPEAAAERNPVSDGPSAGQASSSPSQEPEAAVGRFVSGKVAKEKEKEKEKLPASTQKHGSIIIPKLDPAQTMTLTHQHAFLEPLQPSSPPDVGGLSFDLQRVLFNPGVYQLQDPRSRVYNFDPYLEKIMPVTEFNFDALNEYLTSSKDPALRDLAVETGKRYIGSSSSMTGVLSHFHLLLSSFRNLSYVNLSRSFEVDSNKFTTMTTCPAGIFLRYHDGVYAIDADHEHDEGNILLSFGKSVEKLLTLEKEDFEKYSRSQTNFDADAQKPEQYHYGTIGKVLMRSQLDAHDSRLPGTGMFDLKTRAVSAIRMQVTQHEIGQGYEIKDRYGNWESYEREYYDMLRSAFLKYSLQVRMGRMDGIFVAFHNIERMFGFQYISLPEMDQGLHGQSDTSLGDREFGYSVRMLEDILDRATARYPEQSLRVFVEAREPTAKFNPVAYMNVFVEPMSEETINKIQDAALARRDEYDRRLYNGDGDLEEADGSEEDVNVSDLEDEEEMDAIITSKPQAAESIDEAQADPTAPHPSQLTYMNAGANDDADSHADSAANTAFLDSLTDIDFSPASLQPSAESATQTPAPILGFKIIVRHQVNGKRVGRPENLTEKDIWKLEYTVEEMDPKRVVVKYAMCKKRRENLHASLRRDENKVSPYVRRLVEMSNDGRAWRRKQDELDATRERVVLYDAGRAKD